MPVMLLILTVASIVHAAAGKSPTVLFQEALYQEETEGDLDKAIELYGQVLEQAAEVERIAARTTYQLGMCHLKKGDKDKAAEYFQEVVSYYPEQISTVRKAQAQLDKIAPTALIPSNMLPVEIMGHIIERHFQTGKKANELGIRSNTHIYGVDGFKKYSGGLLDVFNMGNDKWIDKRNIGTFTPNNKELKLYNEQYQEQVFEWEDVEYARGKRCNLIWTPDRPVMPGEFRVLGYIYNKTPELPKTPNGYELKMQNHYGSEVLENFFLILPSTVKIVNESHDITSHQRIQELDIYQFQRHMKGDNNVVTVTVDFVDLTTPNSPVVVETSPINLTYNVPPETTEVTVTFDKEMFPNGYSWCRNQHPYPEKTGQPIFSNGNFSCALPVELRPGQYYRIGINTPPYQSFKSVDGDPTHHYVLVFATADENGQPTKIPPSLIEEVNTTNHKSVTPEELAAIVEKAVLTISTCTETDPKVKESMDSLKGIHEESLVAELSTYLDSETATIRRSAIYILWKGGFWDISTAEQKLLELCTHSESITRGMAALALGELKIAAAYDTLVDMTLHDKDGYARRCGAYALGLLGDPKALPILEKAKEDNEDFVKANAEAAITMLTKLNDEQSDTAELESALTQEMYNDIQPDGMIKFRNPQIVVNEGTEPVTERRFINSDFVELTAMTDEQGKPVEFTAKHEGDIYRYHVIFDPPVMPGQTLNYHSEGTIMNLVKPVANEKDTYRYYMTHSPATGQPTLRIEEYVLPEGAQLLSALSEDMAQSVKDGRIMLRIEKVIPAGGSLTTSFKYRLTERKPDPLKAENLIAEGWSLWGQQKLAEAEAKFTEAVPNDPDNDGAYQGLGWAQLNQGKKQNAEVSFKKCVKLNPENSAALNGLGWIEHGKGNIDKAISWWEKAVKASNGVATASLSGLTQVYMDRKEYDKAVKYYEMWLKAEPNNQDAKAGLEKAKQALK
jgi:tetratricopeptide (TPR) repeat protein